MAGLIIAPYQTMPLLSEEDYQRLKADIALNGVQVPVEMDENGNILDGHHRVQACKELGVTEYPIIIRPGLTEDEKERHSIRLNILRRHLEDDQRREIHVRLRQQLMSYRAIAQLTGVSHDTVKKDIDSTVRNLTVDLPSEIRGRDGRTRPAVIVRNERQADLALSLLDKHTPEGTVDLRELKKEVRAIDREEVRALSAAAIPEPARMVEVRAGEWWRLGSHLLYCGDTSKPEFYNEVRECAFGFADPPYNVEKAEWDKGFQWGHDWMQDQCEVVAVTPGLSEFQRFFPQTRMAYKWPFTCWVENGMARGATGFGVTLIALLFSRGSVFRGEQDFVKLTINTSETDATAHASRKPAGFVARLMQMYSGEGEVVCDPFVGSGTTLLVAERMGRACIAGDIDPTFCSEVIGRWEAETGRVAERER